MTHGHGLRIRTIKKLLLGRLTGHYRYSGGRFPSARELATRYQMSYQTADRLLGELVAEGFLVRRRGSGTFLAGQATRLPTKALLIFNHRALRPESFGDELRQRLQAHLRKCGIPFETTWSQDLRAINSSFVPVLWECSPDILGQATPHRSFGIMINSTPKPGLQTTWIDAVAVDDFSGGVCAARMLSPFLRRGKIVVLGGPREDPRSQQRIAGFCSLVRKASIVHAGTWFAEKAASAAISVAQKRPKTVFCCNDRLAEAIFGLYRGKGETLPKIVGFDDAPIARKMDFSTVALPWEGVIRTVAELIAKRLSGYAGHAAQILLAPQPVHRRSTLMTTAA